MYRLVLERVLMPWLDDRRVTRAHQLTAGVVAQWVTHLRTELRTPRGLPLTETTVRTYATTVNFFLGWMEKQGAPRVRARTPKPRPRVLDVLSRDEMARLEAAAYNERDKPGAAAFFVAACVGRITRDCRRPKEPTRGQDRLEA